MRKIVMILIAAVALALTGCKTTEYMPVVVHQTDTLVQTKIQKDSVWLHDSTYVYEKGDTLTIEKWHTKYVEKMVVDTTYISTTDTVPQPYPVVKEVEVQLTWWQQTRIKLGTLVLIALGILIPFWLLKKKFL